MSERFVLQGDLIVLDRVTGYCWQREASEEPMVWKDGIAYIEGLNQEQFGGYSDWRYPTKDELKTLIMPEEDRTTGFYADPLFGRQRCCWTSTEADHHRACYVDFYYGDVYLVQENYATYYVRAVRNSSGEAK